jgi:hypothetical protein
MIDLFHLSAQLQKIFTSNKWKFYFIVGMADFV